MNISEKIIVSIVEPQKNLMDYKNIIFSLDHSEKKVQLFGYVISATKECTKAQSF